jgi:Fe-S-cluster containining protein
MVWKCKQCGRCCKFFSLPVQNLDEKSRLYLAAHGVKYSDGKIIIPARCKYLTEDNRCSINDRKFKACKIAGEKECKQARLDYAKIKSKG